MIASSRIFFGLFTRNPLIPLCQEPTSGRFQTLFFAPAFLSVPVLHANTKAWSRQHDAQRNPASRASGASSYE